MSKISNEHLPLNVLLCMPKKYASSFRKGIVHFSCAQAWSDYQSEDELNNKQGDILEGVIACLINPDTTRYPLENYDYLLYDNKTFVKSKKDMHMPAFCFYSFDVETNYIENRSNKTVAIEHCIDQSYFDGFLKSSSKTMEELTRSYCFICIPSFEVFYSRLLRSLSKMQIYEDSLILRKIHYSSEKEIPGYCFDQSYPLELFEKGDDFSSQCEYRIIIKNEKHLIKNDFYSLQKGFEVQIEPLPNIKQINFADLPHKGLLLKGHDNIFNKSLELKDPQAFWKRILNDNLRKTYYTQSGQPFTFLILKDDYPGIIFCNKISFAGLYDCIHIYTKNIKNLSRGMYTDKKPYVLAVFNNSVSAPK